MDHMLSPAFSIPSIGTPLHQMEADQQIVANPVYHPAANQQHSHQQQSHDSNTPNGHGMPNQQQEQQQQQTNSLSSMNMFGSHDMNQGLSNSSMMGSSMPSTMSLPQKQMQSASSFPSTSSSAYQNSTNNSNGTSVINSSNGSMVMSSQSSQQQQHQQQQNMQPQQPHQTPQSLMSPMVPMSERVDTLTNIHATMGPATPMTPMTPGSLDPGIVPQLQNIVSTVNLCCKLDLKKIALHARNAEYNPKRFAAVIMRIREPRTTALIFSSGKMVCTGAKSEDDSRLAARKYARIIQKLGFPAKFLDFKIQNMVGSCDVKFPIRLEGLVLTHATFSSYEPELFPGLIYRMVRPRIVLLIFVSGKVVLTGAKVRQEIYEAFDKIFPILKKFKKQT